MTSNQPSAAGLDSSVPARGCGDKSVPTEDYTLRCPVCGSTELYFNQNYSLACSDCGSTTSAVFT